MSQSTVDRRSDANLNADNPYLAGLYGPVADEVDLRDLAIDGEIPVDLSGIYVRNGPDPKYPPRGRYHWFDGDGMLHAIGFAGGRARYTNRWIRTAPFGDEQARGRALWTGLLHPVTDNPLEAPYKDTANTDVIWFGGELLATWYICGLPYRVDPRGLATLGVHDFATGKTRRISAHAKVDATTGELMFFSYGRRSELEYGLVSAAGQLVHSEAIAVPGPRLPHDMAITENYSILMNLPLYFTDEAIRQKRWRVAFHRDVPARFALVPRSGSGAASTAAQPVRWFEAEPCYVYHTVNAWEEGDEVVMVACRVDDPLPAPNYERDGAWAPAMANLRLNARLHRWRFNLVTGQTREETIDDRNSEFPCTNMGRLGRRTRFAYNMSIADTPTLLFDGLIKYDTDTGVSEQYAFGPGRYGSEAVFAPRNGKDGTDVEAGEDDGYVVTIVSYLGEDRAEALVFEATDIAGGPIARVAIPHRIPLGFHACWVPGQALLE
ncbi:MAG: carotenoid oxygenase family protein [Proteobacteria bacterium]|nr:carotenoid oxygenase family protein [Pseudomonadota bacterium]